MILNSITINTIPMDGLMYNTSDGNGTNSTNGTPNTPSLETVNFGDLPGFTAYNVIMLIFVLVPMTIFDILLIVAMFFDKTTPVQIKTVIANLMIGALFVSFALSLEYLSALILGTTALPLPPNDFCHFIVWTMAGGGAARIMFTAVFSVVVFIVVKRSASAINQKVLVVCSVVLWLLAFFVSAPLLFAVVVGSRFLGKTACSPRNTELSSRFGYIIYIPIWVIVCGIVPITITLVMPIITFSYLKRKKVMGDVQFKVAMAKMSCFLIIGIVFNFVGQILPPILIAVLFRNGKNVNDPLVLYVAFTLMSLSLIPTPILVVIYLRGVREALKELLLCYRARGKLSDTRRKHSRSDSRSVSSATRQSTSAGAGVGLPRQNTGMSTVSFLSRQSTGLQGESSLSRQNSEIAEFEAAVVSGIRSADTLGVIVESEECGTRTCAVNGIAASRSHHSGMDAERLQNEEIVLCPENSDSGFVL